VKPSLFTQNIEILDADKLSFHFSPDILEVRNETEYRGHQSCSVLKDQKLESKEKNKVR
jgi:hypothetical protein